MKEAGRPKYCEFCGERLLVIQDSGRYNQATGKPYREFIAACPHVVKVGSGHVYTADPDHDYITIFEELNES